MKKFSLWPLLGFIYVIVIFPLVVKHHNNIVTALFHSIGLFIILSMVVVFVNKFFDIRLKSDKVMLILFGYIILIEFLSAVIYILIINFAIPEENIYGISAMISLLLLVIRLLKYNIRFKTYISNISETVSSRITNIFIEFIFATLLIGFIALLFGEKGFFDILGVVKQTKILLSSVAYGITMFLIEVNLKVKKECFKSFLIDLIFLIILYFSITLLIQ
tara:strand:- start:8661 stop:9317 length:657 start_codon:yes stop_codon:yes gene_type:complete